MTLEQQVAYWQHQSRRHEDRVRTMSDYDTLKQQATQLAQLQEASQTEQQRAVAEARRQGKQEAITEAGSQLVDGWFRAASVGRLSEDGLKAVLEGLDRKVFINAQGQVDTDKVWAHVSAIAAPAQPAPVVPGVPAPAGAPQPPAPVPPTQQVPPAPPGGQDFGQGQPGTVRPGGLAAGREIARNRFGLNNQ